MQPRSRVARYSRLCYPRDLEVPQERTQQHMLLLSVSEEAGDSSMGTSLTLLEKTDIHSGSLGFGVGIEKCVIRKEESLQAGDFLCTTDLRQRHA
jgi:hypothetical protein